MLDWKKHTKDRMIAKHQDNFYVIKQVEVDKTPLVCPICDFLMSSLEDDNAYKNYKCCEVCSLQFYFPNKEKWINENWRPSKEEIEKSKNERKYKTIFFNIERL